MKNELQAHRIITKHKEILHKEGFTVDTIKLENYCYSLSAKLGKDVHKVLVYFGSKGIKTVIQGNKDSASFKSISDFLIGESLFPQSSNEVIEPDEYIGTDESGKGDYFGPLVIAGVYVNKTLREKLPIKEIKDSKLLTDEKILILAPQIRKILYGLFDVVIIKPKRYNELYEKFNNLNKLLAWGHSTVIENILSKQNCPKIISDKFGDDKLITLSLKEHGKKADLFQTIKAERYTAVAMASIIAREQFLRWFIEAEKKLNIKLPKGASASVVNSAKKIKSEHGLNFLNDIAKLHFKITQKL